MVCPNERDVNRVIYALRKPQKKNLTKLAMEVFGSGRHSSAGSGSNDLLDSLTEYLHAAESVRPQGSDSSAEMAREQSVENAEVPLSSDIEPRKVEELDLDDLDAQD